MIIECDTRQQKQDHITKYFDDNEIKYIRNKLYCGDYKRVDSPKVIIDTKKDLMELCGNLCKTTGHNRIKREVERAKEIGCERFIFLITDEKIRTIDEVINWEVPLNKYGMPRTRVKPETLMKIMITMKEKYNIEFIFKHKSEIGQTVFEFLKVGV